MTFFRTVSKAATGGILVRKGVLRNFAKFTGKHLCQSLFFNKVAGLNFAKFLSTTFLRNTSGRLLLPLQQRIKFVWGVDYVPANI